MMYNDGLNPVIKNNVKINIKNDDVLRISEEHEIAINKLEDIVEELKKLIN